MFYKQYISLQWPSMYRWWLYLFQILIGSYIWPDHFAVRVPKIRSPVPKIKVWFQAWGRWTKQLFIIAMALLKMNSKMKVCKLKSILHITYSFGSSTPVSSNFFWMCFRDTGHTHWPHLSPCPHQTHSWYWSKSACKSAVKRKHK